MNYRHAYHAGNHADVLKHIVLARVIEHMKKKDKPFRVIDAHAGIGVYDLTGIEAGKTGEWEGGVAKMAEPFAPEVEALIAPYRDVLARLNPRGGMTRYPGSPDLALSLMRDDDRMIANELHPQDVEILRGNIGWDERVRVTSEDAEVAVKANLPPPERRGVVLIDPPYEQKNEAERAVQMLRQGLRRFAQGVFILWYPVKADDIAANIVKAVRDLNVAATLRAELRVRESFVAGGLAGSGVLVINAPWKLDEDLGVVVPALAARLGLGEWGHGTVDWLVPPK
jgi:23S rRNA (adenine2030-N6)-methyltransferase